MISCHAICKGAAAGAGHQRWLLGVTLLGGANPVPELPVRLFIDHTSLRVSTAAMAVVPTFYPVLSFSQSVPAGVTRIIPDGRTATTVTTTGSVSTGTGTGTVSGTNTFKSFSIFEIGAGNTGPGVRNRYQRNFKIFAPFFIWRFIGPCLGHKLQWSFFAASIRENIMRIAIAASLVVLFGLAGVARADSDDVKWIAQCLKDNQDAKVDASVIQKYCSCMNDKMSSNENQSITQWEKTHPTERKACDREAGWK